MLLSLFFVSFLSTIHVLSLRCYEGSKGLVNGVEQSNFRETTCDENMKHCFESYSDDWTDVTAACQTPSTDEKLLSVCDTDTGCIYHGDINVTVCCCDVDLCNLPSPSTRKIVTTLPPPVPDSDSDSNSTFVGESSGKTDETRSLLSLLLR